MQFKHIKYLFLLIITLCLQVSQNLLAQGFYIRFNDPSTTINPIEAIEFKNNYYVPYFEETPSKENIDDLKFSNPKNIISFSNKNKSIQGIKIIKINTLGTQHTTYNIDTFNLSNKIIDLRLFVKDTCIEMIGICSDIITKQLSAFKIILDSGFNILSKKITSLPDSIDRYIVKVMNMNVKQTFIELYHISDTHKALISLMKLDSNFNLVNYIKYDSSQFFQSYVKAIEFDNFILTACYEHYYTYKISKSSLNITDTITRPMPLVASAVGTTFTKINDSCYISPEKYDDPFSNIKGVLLVLRKSSVDIIDTIQIINPDTLQMMGYQCIDKINTDSVYFVGTFNNDFSSIFGNHNTALMVYNININTGLINWVKYFGWDSYYYCYHVTATTDGGCLISAGIYDWFLGGTQQFDLFLLKLDANGHLTSNIEYSFPKILSFTIYPNPTDDYLKIISESNNLPENLYYSIFDMQGRKVKSDQVDLSSNEFMVNTSLLTAGIYQFIIETKQGILFKSSFIKK